MTNNNLARILRQQRVTRELTLLALSKMSGVSSSHLGRIERGERFPSAWILRKIAKPLGFEEYKLFTLAGYLSPRNSTVVEGETQQNLGGLDPRVSSTLASEPIEVQRGIIGILSILRSLAKSSRKNLLHGHPTTMKPTAGRSGYWEHPHRKASG